MAEVNITLQLARIQNKLKAPKNHRNAFVGYEYRNAEDILEALKPLLLQEECALTIDDDIVEVAGRVYVKATARMTNTAKQEASATAYAREPERVLSKDNRDRMDPAQITGASSSYARKYALNGLFAIDDSRDADTYNEGPAKAKKAPAKPAATPHARTLPATDRQKATINKMMDERKIKQEDKRQWLVDNFGSNELTVGLASQIIEALSSKADIGGIS